MAPAPYVSQMQAVREQCALVMNPEHIDGYLASFRMKALDQFPKASPDAQQYLIELWAWIGLYTAMPFNSNNPMYDDYVEACESIRKLMKQLEEEKKDLAKENELVAAKDEVIAAKEVVIKTLKDSEELGKVVSRVLDLNAETRKADTRILGASDLASAKAEAAKVTAELIEAKEALRSKDEEIAKLRAELQALQTSST